MTNPYEPPRFTDPTPRRLKLAANIGVNVAIYVVVFIFPFMWVIAVSEFGVGSDARIISRSSAVVITMITLLIHFILFLLVGYQESRFGRAAWLSIVL